VAGNRPGLTLNHSHTMEFTMNKHRASSSRTGDQSGFTLVELMIVVAVVGILTAIAYPSYTAHVLKTRRAVASGCLLELSQWMERNYTTCLAYNLTGANCAVAVTDAELPNLACRTELTNAYVFEFAPPIAPAVNPASNLYTLQAVPGGAQAGDTRCGTLTLNQRGDKGAAANTGCWR
jgi:type IV pilus assembly protein PilE